MLSSASRPSDHASRAGVLAAFRRVLLKLEVQTLGTLDPSLPRPVTAELFLGRRETTVAQALNHRVEIIRFNAEMPQWRTRRRFGIVLEDFEERAVADFQIKADARAVFHKVENPPHSENMAVKILRYCQIR